MHWEFLKYLYIKNVCNAPEFLLSNENFQNASKISEIDREFLERNENFWLRSFQMFEKQCLK